MSEYVKLKYRGRTENLTLKLPWLAESITFADKNGRVASVLADDARELVKRNPRSYELLIDAEVKAKAEEAIFSDAGLEGDDVKLAAEEAGEKDGAEQSQDAEENTDDEKELILAGIREHLETLPDNNAIVEFCSGTYEIGELNPRRKRENLLSDAIKAIGRKMA